MMLVQFVLHLLYALTASGCTPSPPISTPSDKSTTQILQTTTTEAFVKHSVVAVTAMPRSNQKPIGTVESPATLPMLVNCSSSDECSEIQYYEDDYDDTHDNYDDIHDDYSFDRHPWSDCIYSSTGGKAAECYNSLRTRTTYCHRDASTRCKIVEQETCLNNKTCTGQWSTWSEHTYNCTNSCHSGTMVRTRHCLKDGELAPGLCLGNAEQESVSNETEPRNCSAMNCKKGRGFVPPLTPEHTSNRTSYLWYVGAGIVGLVFIALTVVGGRVIQRRRSKLKRIERPRGSGPSGSFATLETSRRHNNHSRVTSGSLLEIVPYATFTLVTPAHIELENNNRIKVNLGQNMAQPEAVLRPKQRTSQSSTEVLEAEPALKIPPSLPKNKPTKKVKEKRTKTNNKVRAFERNGHENLTCVAGPTVDDDASKETYAKMDSFTRCKSTNSDKALPCHLRYGHETSIQRNISGQASTSRAMLPPSYSSNKLTSSSKRRPTFGTAARVIENRNKMLRSKNGLNIAQGFNHNGAQVNRANTVAFVSQETAANKLSKHSNNKQKYVNISNSGGFTLSQNLATDQNDYLVPIPASGSHKYMDFSSHYEEIYPFQTQQSKSNPSSVADDYITMADTNAARTYSIAKGFNS